jgi:RHS repeat-associated protein
MPRRIEKDYTWDAGTSGWLETNEIHFVYDGNLVVQSRNANNLPQVTYTRGDDLSGSLQGAGGIGGLLARTDNSLLVSPISYLPASSFYHADGNGNVTYLMYSNQTMAAQYLYDPYGNTISEIGTLADANVYRFSSKEWNANSGLYYYLYRFYDPNLQRWANRDPLGEEGGYNLYQFAHNDAINGGDYLGLATFFPPPARFPSWRPITGGVAGILAAIGGALMEACPGITCHQGTCEACCGAAFAAGSAAAIAGAATLEGSGWGAILGAVGIVAAEGLLAHDFSDCMGKCHNKHQ